MTAKARFKVVSIGEGKGELITDINTIIELAKEKKAVMYRGSRTPAAFLAFFQAMHLHAEIEKKVIFHYKTG